MTDSTRGAARARHLISLLLSFFLMLAILMLSVLLLLQFTLLSPSFLDKQINRSNYTDKIKLELEDTFVSYGMSSGFDEEFFLDLLDKDALRADILLEAKSLFKQDAPRADTEIFREDLYEQLIDYVEAHDERLTPEIDEAVNYLADICTEAYSKKISLPLSGRITLGLVSLRKLVFPAIIGTAVFFLIVLIFLIAIHPKKFRLLPYFVYTLSASALVLCVISLTVLFSGKIERIGISSQSLYVLVTGYLNHTILPLLWIAGLMIILSVAGALFYLLRNRSRQRTCAKSPCTADSRSK
jgi:hypothetical protein